MLAMLGECFFKNGLDQISGKGDFMFLMGSE
jgi:hypothetical protein